MQIGSDTMPKAKRIMYKGQEYTLSKDEINQMRKGKVTADTFDERIAKGWNIKDAIYLNHNFVPFKNGVYLAVPVFNDTYYIKRSDFEDMRQKYNLSTQKIFSRVRKQPIEEVIPEEYTIYEKESDDDMNYLAEQREREERIKERELNRLKERKPHLFNGTPQKHVFDKYCIHLFDNNVFAKVKTDQYGNVQRG